MFIYAVILSILFTSKSLQSVGSLIFRRSNEYSKSTPLWPKEASHFGGHLFVQQLTIIQSEDMTLMDHIFSPDHHFCVGVKLTDHLIMTATSCLISHNMTSIKRLNKGSVLSIRHFQSVHNKNSIHSDKIKVARYKCINVKSDITFLLLRCNEAKYNNGFKLMRNSESLNLWMNGLFIRAIVFDRSTQKLIEFDIPIESCKTFKKARFDDFSTDNESESLMGVAYNSTYNIWCVLHFVTHRSDNILHFLTLCS